MKRDLLIDAPDEDGVLTVEVEFTPDTFERNAGPNCAPEEYDPGAPGELVFERVVNRKRHSPFCSPLFLDVRPQDIEHARKQIEKNRSEYMQDLSA